MRPLPDSLLLMRQGLLATGDRAALRIVNSAASRLAGLGSFAEELEQDDETTVQKFRELLQVWRAMGWIQ